MKPLLGVVVALLVARFEITDAAPQPLALFNATDADDLELGTTRSEINMDNLGLLTTLRDGDESSDAANDPSSPSISGDQNHNDELGHSTSVFSIGDIAESRSDSSPETGAVDLTALDDSSVASSSSKNPSGTESASIAGIATDITSRPTEASITESIGTEDTVSEKVPVLRYVPPLDPMKHMMMMAEAKKQLEISSSTKETSEFTSTLPPTTPKLETTSISKDEVIEADSEENDRHIAESSEVEKLEIAALPNDLENSTSLEEFVDELSSKTSELGDSTDISSFTNTVNINTDEPTTVRVFDITQPQVSTERAADINHESSILIKSSELFSGKEDSLNTKVTTKPFETESAEIFTDVSKPHSSTGSPVTELASTDVFASSSDITSAEPSEELSLERIDDEMESLEISDLKNFNDTTTEKHVPMTEIDTSETPSTSLKPTTTSTSFSHSVPTTPPQPDIVPEEESLEKLSASQSEIAKNLSLEVLEFREANFPDSVSEVSYSEESTESSEEITDSEEVANISKSEKLSSESSLETTTATFLTTLKELLLSALTTTTSSPEKDTGVPEIDSSNLIHKIGSENIPESPLVSEGSDIRSDSSVPNSSPEVLKVELLKADIDSIPSSDSNTLATTISELDSVTELNSTDQSENRKQTTDTPNEFFSSTENSEEINSSQAETETTAKSEVSSTEDSRLDSELVKSSEPESVPVFLNDPTAENILESDKKQLLLNVHAKDRYVSGNNTDTVAAVQFLHYHDKASSEQCFKLVDAHWNYATDLTDENKKRQLEQTLEYSLFHKEAWKNATSFAWKSFNDTLLRRWFKSLSVLGTAALPEDKLNEFNRLKAEMKNTYSTAKVCGYVPLDSQGNSEPQNTRACKLTLEPDLQRILTKSRDYDELTHMWKTWRDAAGKPIREKYLRFVDLSNEAARLNGFSDTGDMWREAYESDTFESDLEMLWAQLTPLYENVHAYVRRRLIQEYGNDKIKDDGPIPAHLFGNMWAQSWVSLLDITQPFPGKPSVDVTPIMEAKNLSALEMFKISEEFFTSLGLKEMPEEFWNHSLIEKPKDREIICHASAWDFCNGKDYRIKQCTDITMEDLITVHHEMGHIQYFLQYARQPNVFREGANPGFHEAIGDVLALSVSTPKHLQSIGLLEEVADDPEGDLNFLLRTALDKVSFLPSGYLIDLWRWGLFSGEIKPEEMNSKWWDLRLKYQGICPPVKRHDTDFDPGAKYHVPGNVPYIRYFVSFVIQFQFHKVLCDAAGHTGPLYKCDIYRSKEAGQILSQVMELGSSEHWSEAMKIMTGGDTNKMDAGPILEYFQPLLAFLEEQNRNETLGWKSDDSTICP